MRLRFRDIIFISLGVLLGGLRMPARAAAAEHPLQVVATSSIIGDWVKTVGADDVALTVIVGADGDPHEYQPVPGDSVALFDANIVFENGLGLENWLDKIYSASQSHALRVVVSAGVDVRHVPGHENDPDPHVWQSVKNAVTMVGNIRDALIKADAEHRADYFARASRYIAELNNLDAWTQRQINMIPASHRKLITLHNAFGYFGQRYGLDVSSSILDSMTTEAADPSARQIADEIDQIRASGVPVIFVENIENPRLVNQVADGAGVRVGPPLYSDALGPAGTSGDTYVKMIRHNVEAIVKSLQ
jgi:zinc/manganese transport system substrate-binding protein